MMQQTIVSLYLAACLMELTKTPGLYYHLAFFNYTLLQWTMNSVKITSSSKHCLFNFIYCEFAPTVLKKKYTSVNTDWLFFISIKVYPVFLKKGSSRQ